MEFSGALAAIFAALGLAVGSFLNVCIDRLPAGRSIVRPPSSCDSCRHQLGARDLVPVFSYIWLRGRCRQCGAHIPLRVLGVELATGLAFPLFYWYYGLNPLLAVGMVYFALFTVLFVVDLEHHLILDIVVYPAMGLAVLASLLYPGSAPFQPLDGLRLAVFGGLSGSALMFLIFLVARGGMGLGDVTMAGLVGLVCRFPGVFVALFLAVLAGGLVAGVLLVFRLKGRREPVPFGPFLAAGAMAVFLFGPQISGWYHNLFPL